MEVHPLADIFPMMGDDDLADLAADIKANGLLHPIAVDDNGVLIDGRNRLRACELAGVEPVYTSVNGRDAAAFIVSANLARRNLSKGQRAMALAMIYPEPDKAGRGKKGKASETDGFSSTRLKQARAIVRHSHALAEDVLHGRRAFDDALDQMEEEQKESASVDFQIAHLRRDAPDLAELVDEERLALNEAYSAMKQRIAAAEAAEANKRETMLRLGESAWQATTAWASQAFVAEVGERIADAEFRRLLLERLRFDPKRLADVERGASAFVGILNEIVGG